jgi:pimeloyl-ACP methyl ester carboxylesterase
MGHRFAFLKIALELLLPAVALLSPVQARAATPAGVRVPTLSWSDCGGGFQCVTATVPPDYDQPQDGTISLALIRLPATDQPHRIGSLFTNPGGPGGSGVSFIRLVGKAFPAAIRARFDLIGFDPRGVGASTPVRCFDTVAEQQAFYSKYGLFPVGAKEEHRCAAVGTSHCAFAADSAQDTAEKFDALLHRILEQPIVVQTSQGPITLTYALTVTLVWEALYSSHAWPQLAADLQTVFQLSGLPSPDALVQPPSYQNGREAELANNCVDTANPDNPFAYPAIAYKADERSPYFGSAWTYVSFPCVYWPVRDRDRYMGPWNRQTARPILLVGTTTDPATTYRDAVSTSHELANARLLTLQGWGHTAFFQGSTCIDQFDAAYLIDGTLPDPGTTCSPDSPPFGSASRTEIQRPSAMPFPPAFF